MEISLNLVYGAAALATVGLLAYLVFALVCAEKF